MSAHKSDESKLEFGRPLSVSAATNAIRRSTRTLRNRLLSISSDASFVDAVSQAYALPLVANARAGEWYVDPANRAGSVYFKSTDGHTNEWSFSKRRLNLGLLDVCAQHGGAVVVDSTRRGKRFPDSLVKTLPIWIAVLNRALGLTEELELWTTPVAVAANERAAIEARLLGLLEDFLALELDLTALKEKLKKPMRPLFVHPESPLPVRPVQFDEFVPLVLCTASRIVTSETTEGEYIQGAGDDHEGWASASGLTPEIFWKHKEVLLQLDDDELPVAIGKLVEEHEKAEDMYSRVSLIAPTKNIRIAAVSSMPQSGTEFVVNCSPQPLDPGKEFHFPLPEGKAAAKKLRWETETFLKVVGKQDVLQAQDVVFVGESGDGAAVALALMVLCLFFDEKGEYAPQRREDMNKALIKRRLAWISASRPSANPPRALLTAVNSVLMERQM